MDENQEKPVVAEPKPGTYARDELDEVERQQVMERFWQAVERIQERTRVLDPEAELALITEVVEEVRQELYEREQAQIKSGHLL